MTEAAPYRIEDLPIGEYAFPGPLRDKLVAAILDGSKTSTSSLLAGCDEADPVPEVGDLEAVVDSDGEVVCVTRNLAVEVVRLADVTLEHALAEGEGFETVAQWREEHERFWTSPEVLAELGHDFVLDDDTEVVCVRFEVVERVAPLTDVMGES